MTDAAGLLHETATYCKPGDEKRPGVVGLPDVTTEQVCPEALSDGADEVTNAYPDGWYVRIMFDELLDANIETLTDVIDEQSGEPTGAYTASIADTHPVKLECESVNGGGMVNVDYDGYYSPSGNRITWPLGPSLVIKPNDPTLVATNTNCQVTINDNVTDKTGNPVPADQRGPYKFKTAPITVLATTPSDGGNVDAIDTVGAGFYVQFNTAVDPASFCDEGTSGTDCEFTFTPDEGGVDFEADSDTEFLFYTGNPSHVDTDYTFAFVQGGKIADRCGRETTFGAPSVADQTKVSFTTNPFKYNKATIATGETASPLKKLSLSFSNVIDPASLDASEYSLTPAPMSGAVALAANAVTFNGLFNLNTDYTFTLNAGATIKDIYGVEYTVPQALTVKWKTQPAITAAFSPADNGSVTRPDTMTPVGVSISFNSAMKGTAADIAEGTEFTVTDSSGAAVTGFAVTSACGATSTSCSVAIKKVLAPGTYTFTMKAGATATDQLGNTYTQAADKVIHFTVKDAPPTPPTPACL